MVSKVFSPLPFWKIERHPRSFESAPPGILLATCGVINMNINININVNVNINIDININVNININTNINM